MQYLIQVDGDDFNGYITNKYTCRILMLVLRFESLFEENEENAIIIKNRDFLSVQIFYLDFNCRYFSRNSKCVSKCVTSLTGDKLNFTVKTLIIFKKILTGDKINTDTDLVTSIFTGFLRRTMSRSCPRINRSAVKLACTGFVKKQVCFFNSNEYC